MKRRRVAGGKGGTKKDPILSPVFFETELLSLGGENPTRYRHIAALASELIAVDIEGRLWSWAWSASAPEPHPLVKALQLEGEEIRLLAGRLLRAAIVTESGKVSKCGDVRDHDRKITQKETEVWGSTCVMITTV